MQYIAEIICNKSPGRSSKQPSSLGSLVVGQEIDKAFEEMTEELRTPSVSTGQARTSRK